MPSSTSDSRVVNCRSFATLTWPMRARGMRCAWGSNSPRRSSPLEVILTSTTRRSFRLRARATSPRAHNWSTNRVTSGSRAIVRAPISPQVRAVGWLPLRMRRTLNRLVDKLNCVLRNFSHGPSRLAAVRRTASIASCSGDAKGRVCAICWAKFLATPAILFVKTTIVKRIFCALHPAGPGTRLACPLPRRGGSVLGDSRQSPESPEVTTPPRAPGPRAVERSRLRSDHEHRAGVVCALTALSVASGEYVAVGDPADGTEDIRRLVVFSLNVLVVVPACAWLLGALRNWADASWRLGLDGAAFAAAPLSTRIHAVFVLTMVASG